MCYHLRSLCSIHLSGMARLFQKTHQCTAMFSPQVTIPNLMDKQKDSIKRLGSSWRISTTITRTTIQVTSLGWICPKLPHPLIHRPHSISGLLGYQLLLFLWSGEQFNEPVVDDWMRCSKHTWYSAHSPNRGLLPLPGHHHHPRLQVGTERQLSD